MATGIPAAHVVQGAEDLLNQVVGHESLLDSDEKDLEQTAEVVYELFDLIFGVDVAFQDLLVHHGQKLVAKLDEALSQTLVIAVLNNVVDCITRHGGETSLEQVHVERLADAGVDHVDKEVIQGWSLFVAAHRDEKVLGRSKSSHSDPWMLVVCCKFEPLEERRNRLAGACNKLRAVQGKHGDKRG